MQLGSLSLDSTSFISTANCIKALATLWFITVYGSYHCIVQGMFLFLYFQVECIAHRFMTPYNIYTCFQCLSNSHQSPTIEAARITNVSRNSRSNGSRSYPRRCDIIQRNDIVTRSVAHQNMILSTIPLIDNMIQSEKWTEMNTLYKKLLSAMSNQRIEFIADIILNPIIHELNSIIKESTQKLVLHPIVLSGSSITANSFIAYNNAFNISDKMNTLINHCIGLTIAIMAKSMKHHAKGSADRITTRSELTKLKLQPKVMKQINRMCYFARMCAKYHKVFWINVSCISYQQSPSIQALVHLLDTDYDIIKGTMLIMQRNNNHNMQMQLKDPWTIEYIKKFFVFCS
eukprot:669329_1